MPRTAKDDIPIWTLGASEADLRVIAQIDEKIEKLAEARQELSVERAKITNRCIQRARYKARSTETTTKRGRRSRKRKRA